MAIKLNVREVKVRSILVGVAQQVARMSVATCGVLRGKEDPDIASLIRATLATTLHAARAPAPV